MKNEIREAYGIYGGRKEMLTEFWWGELGVILK
jgi:hypothetical protein